MSTNGNGHHLSHWLQYEEGGTLGLRGSEGGVIMRDEEHPGGARITLERDCLRVPYAITCGIYGWAVHTRFFADEPTAIHAYEEMQPPLADIVAMLPDVDDPNSEDRADAASGAIEAFVERFP